MSIAEAFENTSEKAAAPDIRLAMDDPQVAGLVANGHTDMARRISYELGLMAQNTTDKLEKLEEACWSIPFDNYDGFLGFFRFAWAEATGAIKAREKASYEAHQAHENFVNAIEEIRKSLDPAYEPMGTDNQLGELFMELPEWRLEDLRKQADALPGMMAAVKPEASAPAAPH